MHVQECTLVRTRSKGVIVYGLTDPPNKHFYLCLSKSMKLSLSPMVFDILTLNQDLCLSHPCGGWCVTFTQRKKSQTTSTHQYDILSEQTGSQESCVTAQLSVSIFLTTMLHLSTNMHPDGVIYKTNEKGFNL